MSARCAAVYAYSAAGPGESTTDLAWDGHASIFELGDLLAETERFSLDSTLAVSDVDLGRVRQEQRSGGFARHPAELSRGSDGPADPG